MNEIKEKTVQPREAVPAGQIEKILPPSFVEDEESEIFVDETSSPPVSEDSVNTTPIPIVDEGSATFVFGSGYKEADKDSTQGKAITEKAMGDTPVD